MCCPASGRSTARASSTGTSPPGTCWTAASPGAPGGACPTSAWPSSTGPGSAAGPSGSCPPRSGRGGGRARGRTCTPWGASRGGSRAARRRRRWRGGRGCRSRPGWTAGSTGASRRSPGTGGGRPGPRGWPWRRCARPAGPRTRRRRGSIARRGPSPATTRWWTRPSPCSTAPAPRRRSRGWTWRAPAPRTPARGACARSSRPTLASRCSPPGSRRWSAGSTSATRCGRRCARWPRPDGRGSCGSGGRAAWATRGSCSGSPPRSAPRARCRSPRGPTAAAPGCGSSTAARRPRTSSSRCPLRSPGCCVSPWRSHRTSSSSR